MDEFLRDIHTIIFKEWILGQSNESIPIVLDNNDNNHITIDTPTSHSDISFHDYNIIEFIVNDVINNKVEFYIHFQMNNLHHAVGLFNEMIACIQNFITIKKKKILLSCSSGLTTGMFADMLNQAAEMLGLNYEFMAVGFMDLFTEGRNHCVILLAPQISYQHAKTQQILKDQLVLNIPPQVFAKYDVNALINFLNEEIDKDCGIVIKEKEKPCSYKEYETNKKILCITTNRPFPPHVNISYRLTQGNEIISENTIIKSKISFRDIYDIIDVIFTQHTLIDIVGISMPGIINDDKVFLKTITFDNTNFLEPLKEKYSSQFILMNNVNCASLGYYVCQNKYQSLSVYSQSSFLRPGGIGNVINGRLMTGRKNFAGELLYSPIDVSSYERNLDGTLKFVTDNVLFLNSFIAPEAIIICCPYIVSKEDLILSLKEHIPEEYIPDITLVEDLRDYMLIGLQQICMETLERGCNE